MDPYFSPKLACSCRVRTDSFLHFWLMWIGSVHTLSRTAHAKFWDSEYRVAVKILRIQCGDEKRILFSYENWVSNWRAGFIRCNFSSIGREISLYPPTLFVNQFGFFRNLSLGWNCVWPRAIPNSWMEGWVSNDFFVGFPPPLRGSSLELVCPFVQVQFLFLFSNPSCDWRIFGVGVGAGTQAESCGLAAEKSLNNKPLLLRW